MLDNIPDGLPCYPIFFSNVNFKTTDSEFNNLCAQVQGFSRSKLLKQGNSNRGLAIAEYSTKGAALQAIMMFNGMDLGGKKMRCEWGRELTEKYGARPGPPPVPRGDYPYPPQYPMGYQYPPQYGDPNYSFQPPYGQPPPPYPVYPYGQPPQPYSYGQPYGYGYEQYPPPPGRRDDKGRGRDTDRRKDRGYDGRDRRSDKKKDEEIDTPLGRVSSPAPVKRS